MDSTGTSDVVTVTSVARLRGRRTSAAYEGEPSPLPIASSGWGSPLLRGLGLGPLEKTT